MGRIIINILDDDIDDLLAVERVYQVISGGKVSGNLVGESRESYCYGTVFTDEEVFTDKPRKRSPNTYTFYIKKRTPKA